jgi:hypothetical protein
MTKNVTAKTATYSRNWTFQMVLSLALTLVPLSGCLQSRLTDPTPAPEGIVALSEGAVREITLQVEFDDNVGVEGSQFVLGVLPVGSVRFEQADERIFNELYEELAINGFAVGKITNPPSSQGMATVKVVLSSATCSAYDLLLARRNVCQIKARTVISLGEKILADQLHVDSESEWAKYGFSPQLSVLLDRLLDRYGSAVVHLVQNI